MAQLSDGGSMLILRKTVFCICNSNLFLSKKEKKNEGAIANTNIYVAYDLLEVLMLVLRKPVFHMCNTNFFFCHSNSNTSTSEPYNLFDGLILFLCHGLTVGVHVICYWRHASVSALCFHWISH